MAIVTEDGPLKLGSHDSFIDKYIYEYLFDNHQITRISVPNQVDSSCYTANIKFVKYELLEPGLIIIKKTKIVYIIVL